MKLLHKTVLETCMKIKGPPLAIVYGIPKLDKNRAGNYRPMDEIIEQTTNELDEYLLVNGLKTHLVAFDEFKSTQISSIVLNSLNKNAKNRMLSKAVINFNQDVDNFAAKVILDMFLIYLDDFSAKK